MTVALLLAKTSPCANVLEILCLGLWELLLLLVAMLHHSGLTLSGDL